MSRPPPPEGLDLSESKVPALVGVFASTWALALIAVGLRVLCRRVSKNKLWLDDWLIIASLLWTGIFLFDVCVYMVREGFGRHIWVTETDSREDYYIGLFISELVYIFGIVFVKWSILAFYWRIFSADTRIRLPIWIMFTMVCMWGISVFFVRIFQCVPLRAFWMRFNPVHPMTSGYTCGVQVQKSFIGSSITNMATDILLVILPLPFIWNLHIPIAQRVAILAIFVVGIFVTAVSTVRLVFVIQLDLSDPDLTWTTVDEMMWTGVEVNIATVCGK